MTPESSTPAARSTPSGPSSSVGGAAAIHSKVARVPVTPCRGMGWDFKLNLLQPFQTLYDSLTQRSDGGGGTGVQEPDGCWGLRTHSRNLLAGFIIDFGPARREPGLPGGVRHRRGEPDPGAGCGHRQNGPEQHRGSRPG